MHGDQAIPNRCNDRLQLLNSAQLSRHTDSSHTWVIGANDSGLAGRC